MRIDSSLHLTEKEIEKFGSTIELVKDSLTLPNPEYITQQKFGKGRFYKKIDSHICYLHRDSSGYFHLPRYYFGEPNWKSHDLSLVQEGRETSYESSIILRKYQEDFFNENSSSLDCSGLLIEMPCGHGKTLTSIWLSHKIGKQTMVLVPTYYLANQWKAAIEKYTTATTHVLKSTDKEIPTDRDFTIVVTDLLSARVIPKKLVENIGHVIMDEAHRIGAETYLPLLKEIPAKHRTALTATFRRADGVHKILKYHFGEHIKMKNQFPYPSVYAIRTGVTIPGILSKTRPHKKLVEFMEENEIPFNETKSTLVFKPNFLDAVEKGLETGKVNKTNYREISTGLNVASKLAYASIDSYLNENSGRRKIAIKVIQEALDKGRCILFLSKRKDMLKMLHKYFAKYEPMLIISETNSRTPEQEEYLQTKCPLVLGVTQLAKEGLDIERLDTLVIHLPLKDTEQAIGRISRLHPTKKKPVALYLLDDCPMLYATFRNAKKMITINGEFKGEIGIKSVGEVL